MAKIDRKRQKRIKEKNKGSKEQRECKTRKYIYI